MHLIIIIQLTKSIVIQLWTGTFSMGTHLRSEHGNQGGGEIDSPCGVQIFDDKMIPYREDMSYLLS
jgi:hypothetical protein